MKFFVILVFVLFASYINATFLCSPINKETFNYVIWNNKPYFADNIFDDYYINLYGQSLTESTIYNLNVTWIIEDSALYLTKLVATLPSMKTQPFLIQSIDSLKSDSIHIPLTAIFPDSNNSKVKASWFTGILNFYEWQKSGNYISYKFYFKEGVYIANDSAYCKDYEPNTELVDELLRATEEIDRGSASFKFYTECYGGEVFNLLMNLIEEKEERYLEVDCIDEIVLADSYEINDSAKNIMMNICGKLAEEIYKKDSLEKKHNKEPERKYKLAPDLSKYFTK